MKNIKFQITLLFVLASVIGFAQSFSSPTTIPANGNVTVNGVTITTVSTGDVNNGISANSQTPTLIYSQSFQASGIGTGSIEPVSINTLAGNKRVKIITTCTERIHSPLLARNYVGYQIGIRAMIH